jgi:hypothetical protein
MGHGTHPSAPSGYDGFGTLVRLNRCLEPERGLAVSGAAVAPASGGVNKQRSGKRHREGA